MAYIDWWNRTGPITMGERFGLNEISIARKTLSPIKSYTEDRIDMKPGGIVEPGVTHYGVKSGDTSRPQNRPAPMSKELAAWYEKNKATLLKDADGNFKPARAWENLEISERMSVKSQFKKRNNPFYKNLRNLDILKDFLQKQKDAGRTLFKNVAEISKEAGVNLKNNAVVGVINRSFPNTFNYEGLDLNKAPGVLKRVKELAKTNTVSEMINILFDEKLIVSKNDVSIRKLMKDNKIPIKAATQDIDNLVKTYVKKNPKITDVNQIAKNLNIDPTTVRLAANRLNIKNLTSLQTGILKEIKALDNIVKNSLSIINDPDMTPTAKNKILQQRYLKATGKKFVELTTEEFGSRLSRLAKLYSGEGRIKAFKNIKAPLNYLDTSNALQKNIIEMVSKAKQLSNYDVGQMLGLPKNQLKLISDTAGMMKAFDFSVAGDHTDIKSMMKDFPKYKENFSRIEYIKNNLNLYKKRYDLQINALRKKAQQANNPETRLKFLNDAKILQEEFAKKTGYRIGTFDIKNNRVVLNPQTERLIDLKNPRNTALQTAMKNFAKTSSLATGQIGAATKEIFSALDKKLMNASVKERIEIFKKIQGTEAAKQSKYLKALSKLPGKYGQAAKAIIFGTAATTAITTLANAETLEPSDKEQEASVIGDVVSAVAENPIKSAAAVIGGDVALNKAKLSLKTLRGVDRALGPWMTPLIGLYTAITGSPPDPTSAANLLIPSFWNSIMKRYNWQDKSADPLKRRIINAAKRGLIPTNLMPVISRVSGIGTAAFAAKYVAEESQPNIFRDEKTGDLKMKDEQVTPLLSNMIKDYHWRFQSDDSFEKEYGIKKEDYKSELPEFLDLEKQKVRRQRPEPLDSYFMGGIASLIK